MNYPPGSSTLVRFPGQRRPGFLDRPEWTPLLFWLGGCSAGAVARVPSFVAPCAPFLTPLVPCAVPDVVLLARFAAPDGARFPTSARLWGASWAWRARWWSELPLATPSELQARPQVQTPSRLKESECLATTDLFWLRTFTHFRLPSLLPQSMAPNIASQLLIWIDQAMLRQAAPMARLVWMPVRRHRFLLKPCLLAVLDPSKS